MLTKTETVLNKVDSVLGDDARAFFDNFDNDGDRSLSMSIEDWNDMGRPNTITVAVVPGDTLNNGILE